MELLKGTLAQIAANLKQGRPAIKQPELTNGPQSLLMLSEIPKSEIPTATTNCMKCNHTGWISHIDPEKAAKIQGMLSRGEISEDYSFSLINAVKKMSVCECVIQTQMAKRLEFAKIPEEFKNITIKSFDLKYYSKSKTIEGLTYYQHAAKAKRVAANFVEKYLTMKELNTGLYIYFKEPGTGKTRLAVAVLNALMVVHKVSGAYVVVKDLLDEIKETFNKDSDSEYTKGQIIEAVQRVDVLMLDDIGVEHTSDFAKGELYSILNKRYIEHKLTIFTSNCSLEQLPHGHRLISRIEGMTYAIFLPGDDIRRLISRKVGNETLKDLLES